MEKLPLWALISGSITAQRWHDGGAVDLKKKVKPTQHSAPYLSVLMVNHDVVGFDISVHDSHAMTVIQSLYIEQRKERSHSTQVSSFLLHPLWPKQGSQRNSTILCSLRSTPLTRLPCIGKEEAVWEGIPKIDNCPTSDRFMNRTICKVNTGYRTNVWDTVFFKCSRWGSVFMHTPISPHSRPDYVLLRLILKRKPIEHAFQYLLPRSRPINMFWGEQCF